MKRVDVILLPAKLDEIANALAEVGIESMTVCEARVFGSAGGRRVVYRGSSHVADWTLRMKVEVVVRDAVVPRILEVLERSELSPGARRADDTSVFVSDVVDTVRIRAGQRGEGAPDRPINALPSEDRLVGASARGSLAGV
jgi:nitrogen regulatory protein P-II 1